MMRTAILFAAVGGLSSCASAVKLENVAGTWTCPRIDGVCADISTIDVGLTGDGSGLQPGPRLAAATDGFLRAGASEEREPAPARTGDEVARIVIAPSVDAHGHYHGLREVFAVMKQGGWIEAPAGPAPDARPVDLLQRGGAARSGESAVASPAPGLSERARPTPARTDVSEGGAHGE